VVRAQESKWRSITQSCSPRNVATVLLLEHAITLFAPLWERYLFFGSDRPELLVFEYIEEPHAQNL
jgi:hypothetical protein